MPMAIILGKRRMNMEKFWIVRYSPMLTVTIAIWNPTALTTARISAMMPPTMTIMDTDLGGIMPPMLTSTFMMTGVGADLHLHGDMVVFMVASTEVITDTTLGDGTVSDMEMAGTTGVGEAMAITIGAGEATDGAVITVLTSILLIETTLITIPAVGSAIITTIEITLIALVGGAFTTLIPTLGALL